MEKRIKLLLACLFLSVGMVMAQTKITGTVISEEDGEPIVGATVKIAGTSQGTLTDANGKFSVTLPEGKKSLQVSYVGMVSQSVTAKNNMRIVLASDSKVLQDVVVLPWASSARQRLWVILPLPLTEKRLPPHVLTTLCQALLAKWLVCRFQQHQATRVHQMLSSSVV